MKHSPDGSIKPQLRPARVEDFVKVYPLLREINDTRLQKQDWFTLFQNHWTLEEFSPGLVLQAGDDIVGYLGTIYSRQNVQGTMQLFCNLSSWIVKDAYRSHSFRMILPLVQKKDVVLTSFSSNDAVYEIYKKLGFKDSSHGRRIVYPFLSLYTRQYKLISDKGDIERILPEQDRQLFRGHAHFNNDAVVIAHKNHLCLIMGVRRKNLLRIYDVSDKGFFKQHLTHFRMRLFLYFKVKTIRVDEQLLDGEPLFLSRKICRGHPYQYKAPKGMELKPMPRYSEIFLLNM